MIINIKPSEYNQLLILGVVIINLIVLYFALTRNNAILFLGLILFDAFFILFGFEYLKVNEDFSSGNSNVILNEIANRINSRRSNKPSITRNRINKNRIKKKILQAKIIKKLETPEAKKLTSINFKDSIADCLICYRNIPNEHLITCPHCINFFHKTHLKTWLRRKQIVEKN